MPSARAGRAVRPRAGDHSPWRAEPFQVRVRMRAATVATRPLVRGDGRLGLRNDGAMPLICPTSQIVFRSTHPACAFAWGCFDESAFVEVVAGPKICLYWKWDGFTWPAACFAGADVFACGE